MQSVLIFCMLLILHVTLYGVLTKFSGIAVFGAAISIGLYAFATLVTTNWKAWTIGLSWLTISVVYFMTFILIQAPAFQELRQFGWQIIHRGELTGTGLVYVLTESIVQGGLLAAAVYLVRLVRVVGNYRDL